MDDEGSTCPRAQKTFLFLVPRSRIISTIIFFFPPYNSGGNVVTPFDYIIAGEEENEYNHSANYTYL